MASLREKILNTRPKVERADVEGIDEPLYVRRMSGGERFAFFQKTTAMAKAAQEAGEDRPLFVPLLLATLCDEHGNRVMNDDDAEALKGVDGVALDRLFKKASELNAVGKDAETNAEKKSLIPPGGDGSKSP